MVLLNILKVQRNPKYWGSDAHDFIPERFEPEKIEKIHSYAFSPFTRNFIVINSSRGFN
jgi:cytochrome P450